MIAHLGMYDVPGANAVLWSGIRVALGYGPETLDASKDFWAVWTAPDLLFAQTCGYPFRARLHPRVRLVATPDYGLPDCPPGHYRSVFVKRAGDPRGSLAAMDGARFAYNEALSQSGWAGPITHLTRLGLRPGALVRTGAHAASLRAVLAGDADFAGLDALTWVFLERDGATAGARVFARTDPSPALPYITGPEGDPDALAAALETAIARLDAPVRTALHLTGIVRIGAADYLAVHSPPGPDSLLLND